MRIGLAIDLSSSANAHTHTFLEAVSDWQRDHPDSIEVVQVSDDRTALGGVKAAEILIAHQVSVVVGHFSSRAALAAWPLYQSANTPLLLPAATDPKLSQTAHASLGRMCADDLVMLEALRRVVYPWRVSNRLAWHIENTHEPRWLKHLPTHSRRPQTVGAALHVVVGSEAFAEDLLLQQQWVGSPHHWLLVDDAASQRLLQTHPNCLGLCPCSNWKSPLDYPMPPFYWETYCALDVAFEVGKVPNAVIGGQSYSTRLGLVSFDDQGLASTATFGLIRPVANPSTFVEIDL